MASGYTYPLAGLPIPQQQQPSDASLMFDLNNQPFPTYPADNMQMDYGESFDWVSQLLIFVVAVSDITPGWLRKQLSHEPLRTERAILLWFNVMLRYDCHRMTML